MITGTSIAHTRKMAVQSVPQDRSTIPTIHYLAKLSS